MHATASHAHQGQKSLLLKAANTSTCWWQVMPLGRLPPQSPSSCTGCVVSRCSRASTTAKQARGGLVPCNPGSISPQDLQSKSCKPTALHSAAAAGTVQGQSQPPKLHPVAVECVSCKSIPGSQHKIVHQWPCIIPAGSGKNHAGLCCCCLAKVDTAPRCGCSWCSSGSSKA